MRAGGTLSAVRFELAQRAVVGDPVRVVEGVSVSTLRATVTRAADGTSTDVRLTTSANLQAPTLVTPDGAFVVGYENRAQTGYDLVTTAYATLVNWRTYDVSPHGLRFLVLVIKEGAGGTENAPPPSLVACRTGSKS